MNKKKMVVKSSTTGLSWKVWVNVYAYFCRYQFSLVFFVEFLRYFYVNYDINKVFFLFLFFIYILVNVLWGYYGLLVLNFIPLISGFIVLFVGFFKTVQVLSIWRYTICLFLLYFKYLVLGFLLPFYCYSFICDGCTKLYWLEFVYLEFSSVGIEYSLGLDYLSCILVVLTVFISFFSLFSSLGVDYLKYFFFLIFLSEFFAVGSFLSTNVFFFYLYFELSVFPMFFMILVWGSRIRRIYAAYQFLLYTVFSSLLFLVGLLYILRSVGTLDYNSLFIYEFDFYSQLFLWFLFFVPFAIKTPLFPFHIWLPEAHTEAPTSGSILLAGILLKLGGYGMIRFLFTFLKDASFFFTPIVVVFSICGLVVCGFIAMRQDDMKRIVAYSSIVHMNFFVLVLFTFSKVGFYSCSFLLLSHGLISSGLFAVIGMLYDRYGSRNLIDFFALKLYMPRLYKYFFILVLANIGFPCTSGFIGELLGFISIYNVFGFEVFLLVSFGLILNVLYNFLLLSRVFYGNCRDSSCVYVEVQDLIGIERFVLFFLVFFVILLGIFPGLVFLKSGMLFFFFDFLLYY